MRCCTVCIPDGFGPFGDVGSGSSQSGNRTTGNTTLEPLEPLGPLFLLLQIHIARRRTMQIPCQVVVPSGTKELPHRFIAHATSLWQLHRIHDTGVEVPCSPHPTFWSHCTRSNRAGPEQVHAALRRKSVAPHAAYCAFDVVA